MALKKERLTEIINTLLAKDESVETAGMLKEVLDGFDDTSQKEVEELTKKYEELEKKYVDTFKKVLNGEVGNDTDPEPQPQPKSDETTFDDIFEEE